MMPEERNGFPTLFISAACLNCVFQLFWFSSKCFNQIDYDGMAYIGIARHLRDRDFYLAIDAFRSPLLSWLIAGLSLSSANYLHIGKLINIGTFLLSAGLLYILTQKLWHSMLVSSVAVLLFTLGRGLFVSAMEMVTPDFLFSVCVLTYFIILLNCFRQNRLKDWLLLGAVHGVAFLAKAFALPWLTLCTLIALSLSSGSWKTRITRLCCAGLIPLIVALAWAGVLHSKYGVFTTGSQFKANYLQWTVHAYREHRDVAYQVLRNTTKDVDGYVVDDPMPPGSWPWKYPITFRYAVPKMIIAAVHNIPLVLKELVIVVTPGVLLAFVAVLVIVASRRCEHSAEWQFSIVVAASALSLVGAYSMLVFDARYLFPLIPLILTVASSFLIPNREFDHDLCRKMSVVLVFVGILVATVYSSSPFRLLTRDFQDSCYDAGNRLRRHAGSSVVSIGSGPFPEHGVGWEAGYKASFFANRRIIATMDALPESTQLTALMCDIRKASPEAIIVWGNPRDSKFEEAKQHLLLQYPEASREAIIDSALGEVGVAIFIRP